jgi:hypothetical protein
MVVVGSSRQMQVNWLPDQRAAPQHYEMPEVHTPRHLSSATSRFLNQISVQAVANRVKKAIVAEAALHEKVADIGSDGRRRCAAAATCFR